MGSSCSEAQLSKTSQNFKSKRLWECSEPMTHGILLYLLSHKSSHWGSVNSKWVRFFINWSKDPKEEQLPLPGQMWSDSTILQHRQLGELVQSSMSLLVIVLSIFCCYLCTTLLLHSIWTCFCSVAPLLTQRLPKIESLWVKREFIQPEQEPLS